MFQADFASRRVHDKAHPEMLPWGETLPCGTRSLVHDLDDRVLHFLRDSFQLRCVEQRKQRGWL